jgi:hypothetical protein
MKLLITSASPTSALIGSILAQAQPRGLLDSLASPVILIILWTIALMIASGLVRWLWNATLPQAFGLRTVTLEETARLLIIMAIIALFIVVTILLVFGGAIGALLNKH